MGIREIAFAARYAFDVVSRIGFDLGRHVGYGVDNSHFALAAFDKMPQSVSCELAQSREFEDSNRCPTCKTTIKQMSR